MPLFLILFILLCDIFLNFIAWLVSTLHIESSVLSQQWENMGFTFVKFTYEKLYQDRRRGFFWIFTIMISLLFFVLFLGLRVDQCLLLCVSLNDSHFMVLDMGISTFMDCFNRCV